jgi:hypothetical protein
MSTCSGAVAILRKIFDDAAVRDQSDAPYGDLMRLAVLACDENPQCRNELLVFFDDAIENDNYGAPWTLLKYCFRKLRWPEIHEALTKRLHHAMSTNDWRAINLYSHLRSTYDENWESSWIEEMAEEKENELP